jgi:hypothetical protein
MPSFATERHAIEASKARLRFTMEIEHGPGADRDSPFEKFSIRPAHLLVDEGVECQYAGD